MSYSLYYTVNSLKFSTINLKYNNRTTRSIMYSGQNYRIARWVDDGKWHGIA